MHPANRMTTIPIIEFETRACRVPLRMNLGTYQHIPHDVASGAIHQANFFEIIICRKEAAGTLCLDHQRIDLHQRQAIFISPMQRRQWVLPDGKLEAYYLIFQESFLSDFFADKFFAYRLQYFYQTNKPLHLPIVNNLCQRVEYVLSEMGGELKNMRCDSEHLIRSLLYFILIRLNRDYSLHYQLGTETQLNNHAYQFKQLLETHIGNMQRVEEYADLMGISRITLNKIVRRQFNMTATELLKQRLMHEIKNLLLFTPLTVYEIAHRLNFSEPNHLNRFFKQQSNMTPMEYRMGYQNGSI